MTNASKNGANGEEEGAIMEVKVVSEDMDIADSGVINEQQKDYADDRSGIPAAAETLRGSFGLYKKKAQLLCLRSWLTREYQLLLKATRIAIVIIAPCWPFGPALVNLMYLLGFLLTLIQWYCWSMMGDTSRVDAAELFILFVGFVPKPVEYMSMASILVLLIEDLTTKIPIRRPKHGQVLRTKRGYVRYILTCPLCRGGR